MSEMYGLAPDVQRRDFRGCSVYFSRKSRKKLSRLGRRLGDLLAGGFALDPAHDRVSPRVALLW